MLRNAVSVTQADDVITDENNQPERKQYAGNGTMNNLTFHQQDPHSHITCTAFSIFFQDFCFGGVSWTSWGYKISGRHDWS